MLFQRLPNSPRLPGINGAYQGGERLFFQSTTTSRFRQLADEQLRDKKRRARDAASRGSSSSVLDPRPASLRRKLVWLSVVLLVYYAFDCFRSRQIPFHYSLPNPPLRIPSSSSSSSTSSLTTPFVATPSRQIPPYLHYVFGLHKDFGGKPFSLTHYICMTSALSILKPETLYLHYVHPPSGFYWEEFVRNVQDSNVGTKLELRKVRDVTQVFGNPVWHYAHKADVIRLEALKELGGIYLDVDVLVTRDLEPLYKFETVLGMESQPILDPNLPPSGLCNALILARPYAPFISRWLDSYKSFDPNSWAGHSVSLPWQLAQQHPDEITVLNKYAFFWPLWHEEHLRLIHQTPLYSFARPPLGSPRRRSSPQTLMSGSQFVYHLWESFAYDKYLSRYTPDLIHGLIEAGSDDDETERRGQERGEGEEEEGKKFLRELGSSSFALETRKWVGEGFRERWKKAKRAGLVQ